MPILTQISLSVGRSIVSEGAEFPSVAISLLSQKATLNAPLLVTISLPIAR
ncbi:hypothetical protein LEP1GSC193_2238 [Leptospira alstonii serovar Pingchang str. 80-412]|uniref:Uncharacterized protein n=2 Tax=Leptospira alstonii TaxID=28452 RepID=M6CW94_9LEPT|nr:hypothetical protein LEP1GSC194_0358 [Leptospira alstonii serovar Sichuan str. 79601]EQA79906.1 hypothetical protein LEP1GSC193_2238 [Leptospira alstonii serovar Pingchang str. 80-412]